MFTIVFDSKPAISRASQNRPPTPYLRGLVFTAPPEPSPLAEMKGKRVIVWNDETDLEALQGKIAKASCQLRDWVQVDVPGQTTKQQAMTIVDVNVTAFVEGKEAAEMRGQIAEAQFLHLKERGARTVVRTPDPLVAEKRAGGELATPAYPGVAGTAAAASLAGTPMSPEELEAAQAAQAGGKTEF